jgi:hypothetical protein
VPPNYPNLKKQTLAGTGANLKPWSKENLFDGFKKFFDENGRYPTAPIALEIVKTMPVLEVV